MGIAQHLADPWGLAAGGLAGLTAGVVAALASAPVGVVAVAALGVAIAVHGARVVLAALAGDPGERSTAARPVKGGAADVWLGRAEKAVRTLSAQTAAPTEPSVRALVADVDDRAGETLADLRRLAAQVAAVESATARIDIVRLRTEYRLADERSRSTLTAQIEAYERLRGVRQGLTERMQHTALSVEGLIARVAEVIALASTIGGVQTASARISDLSAELDALRAGLRETEEVSRRALGRTGSGSDAEQLGGA